MSLPGFSAEVSLRQTGRHYVTGRRAAVLAAQVNAVGPAMRPETIRVFGCRPGALAYGEGEDMVCLDPEPPPDVSGVPFGHMPDWPVRGIGDGPDRSGLGITKPARRWREEARREPWRERLCSGKEADTWKDCMYPCLDHATFDHEAYENCWRSHGCQGDLDDPDADDLCYPCPKADFYTAPVSDEKKDMCETGCFFETLDAHDCVMSGLKKNRILRDWKPSRPVNP